MSDERNNPTPVLDCKGLACPQPVILTKKALDQRPPQLTVIVDNAAAKENVAKFAAASGYGVNIEPAGGVFRLHLLALGSAPAALPADAGVPAAASAAGPVFLISRATLGQGDDQLGAILMKSFFVSLQELQPAPRAILLLNGGVQLAVDGSPVLAGLQELSRRGVNVMVCGTCLDFFQLKDKLAVGSVTNMYSILTELTGASRAITL